MSMYDYFMDYDYDNREPDPNINYEFWTMRDGTQIHISDMGKSHLINTIRMLEQGDNPYAEGYIEVMKEELKSRSTTHDAINDFN